MHSNGRSWIEDGLQDFRQAKISKHSKPDHGSEIDCKTKCKASVSKETTSMQMGKVETMMPRSKASLKRSKESRSSPTPQRWAPKCVIHKKVPGSQVAPSHPSVNKPTPARSEKSAPIPEGNWYLCGSRGWIVPGGLSCG